MLAARVEALEGEITRRVDARLCEIEHEPPVYLTRALGRRPAWGGGLERWREGVRAIEGYRERHGIDDPQRALGPEPTGRPALGERRALVRAVEEVRAELDYLTRAHERPATARAAEYDGGPRHGLGRGMERGPGHGPRLGMGR